MAEIKAEEKPVSKVFSGDYLLEVPPYQRPYAWTTEEVGELLDDLVAARREDPETPYFLGSIVMVRTSDGKRHELIDGQQRLTTLTMLLCVARDLATDAGDKDRIDEYVAQRANKYEGTTESSRILVRERDRKEFEEWVLKPGSTSTVTKESAKGRNDSQERIAENVVSIREALEKLEPEDRDGLIAFVIQRCYLIVATTTDRDSAYRMFSVLNSRGLDLSPTDILKADVIGGLRESQQQTATDTWETLEDELGREKFRSLFQAICSVFIKDKIHQALETAFQRKVLAEMSPDTFIESVLKPYASAYIAFNRCSYPDTSEAHPVNRILKNLVSLDDYTVLPPAMAYIRHANATPDDAIVFFRHLERLAFGLRLLRRGVEARIRRFARIVEAIESAASDGAVHDALTDDLLAFNAEESRAILDALNGPLGRHPLCKHLLLLLDGAIADAGVQYDRPNCTIEHVLPQTPSSDSPWLDAFPDENSRVDWTQRMGNLVLLSRPRNSAASNYPFSKKRDEYFKRTKVAQFALTLDVLDADNWTPTEIEARQRRLIDVLQVRWNLPEA